MILWQKLPYYKQKKNKKQRGEKIDLEIDGWEIWEPTKWGFDKKFIGRQKTVFFEAFQNSQTLFQKNIQTIRNSKTIDPKY